MRYFLHLSYSGTHYHGWQIQKNAPSVQATLEQALSLLVGEAVSVTGCGRTDTGVHAKDYWAHFDCQLDLKRRGFFCYKINAILPTDIRVFDIFAVSAESHARFDATSRTYRYFIRTAKEPFLDSCSAIPPGCSSQKELDIDAMNRAANNLLGTHDFTSFSKGHTQTKTNICTVTQAHWFYQKSSWSVSEMLVFEVSADRFLRNMVRCMVGTLLEIGRGKQPVEWILQVMDGKNRSAAGNSVAPQGLFLWNITYDNLKIID